MRLKNLFIMVYLVGGLFACNTPQPPTATATVAPTLEISTPTLAPEETPTLSPPSATPTLEVAATETSTSVPATDPPTTVTPLPPTATNTALPSATPTLVVPQATVTPPPTPSPTPAPVGAEIPLIALQPVATDFVQPVYLTHAGDGSGRLFVVQRHGKVQVLLNGVVQSDSFLDIDGLIGSGGQEQGLLSLAFHPNFTANRRLFVYYTDNNGDVVIAEYQATPNLGGVDLATARILLTVAQPYGNHNGGQLQFGPDGYLYIGLGDGGSANDPLGNGQNLSTLLGTILRIDINGENGEQPYAIPANNPFINQNNARPEIWAWGLRNPWRFSFDRGTGDLYIADVGQNLYEEIDFQVAGSGGGLNYGWNTMEGTHCFGNSGCNQDGLSLPVAEYSRDKGCSVTGGYVYRGVQFPTLSGVYFYADYCTGNIWGLRVGGEPVLLFESGITISSFGQDQNGEVYLLDLQGDVYQLILHP